MPPPPGLQTPREVTLYYDSIYWQLVSSGHAVPFIYPWAGVGAFAAILYLLIDHRRSALLRLLRFPIFAFLLVFQGWCIATNVARHPAASFGIGLLSAWGVLWVFTLIIANDGQANFTRVERRRGSDVVDANGDVKKAPRQHNYVSEPTYYWASYPEKLGDRLDWVADVFCSFRGVGWNWQLSGIPPAPKNVEASLRGGTGPDERGSASGSADFTISRSGIRRYSSRTALLRHSIRYFIVAYFAVDLIKVLMHRDAYFWGYTDSLPPGYLPQSVRASHFLVKSYRLLISLAGVYTCLGMVFKLGPLFFCGVLGPEWIGVRGEAWMNPADMFGSFQNVLDRGLAGWWAGWWHQVFRFGFEAPTTRLLQMVKTEKKSPAGGAIGLSVAFFLSGCLHASGSYTQMGETRPLMGPMRFFLLQGLGIAAQTVAAQQLSAAGVLQRLPVWTKQLANFVVVHAWLYYTAPLLMDDFSKGGIWLFEPLPVSPLRGLGLGAKDDGWWCWWNGLAFWHQGEHFWETGIAF